MLMSEYREHFSTSGLYLNQDKYAIIVLRSIAQARMIMITGQPDEVKKVLVFGWF